jgi:hypothetical protein
MEIEFEKTLAARFPFIPWRDPIRVSLISDPSDVRLGCRMCIARWGMHGEDTKNLPRTAEEFAVHMREAHSMES